MPIRTLLVDDHVILRDIFRCFLSDSSDVEVVAEAASGEEALDLLDEQEVDVVLLDWSLPGLSGLETLQAMHAWRAGLPVLMMSMQPEIPYALHALRTGASGYIGKQHAARLLVHALRLAARGSFYVSSTLAAVLNTQVDSERRRALLSDRERAVEDLLAVGLNEADIAYELGLLDVEVRTVRARLAKKLSLLGERSRVSPPQGVAAR